MDSIFSHRLTVLRINTCFLPPEELEELLKNLSATKTLQKLHINFRKPDFGKNLLKILETCKSLEYLELQCKKNVAEELENEISRISY